MKTELHEVNLTPELFVAALEEIAIAHQHSVFNDDDVLRHAATGGRDMMAQFYARRACARGRTEALWVALREAAEGVISAELGADVLVQIAKAQGMVSLYESEHFANLTEKEREDLDPDPVIGVVPGVEVHDAVYVWSRYAIGVFCVRRSVISHDPDDADFETARAALDLAYAMHDIPGGHLDRFLERLRVLSEEP